MKGVIIVKNVQELKELIANEYLNKFFTFYLSRTPVSYTHLLVI